MKFIETIKNIWKVEDLRNRLLTTLLFVLIYRFGSYVVLPGINPQALSALHSQTAGGLMALLDMFSGGAFSNASVFYHCATAYYCSALFPEDAEGR